MAIKVKVSPPASSSGYTAMAENADELARRIQRFRSEGARGITIFTHGDPGPEGLTTLNVVPER
jgi:hypothetical protein